MGGISGLISLICMVAISSFNVGDTAPSLEGTQWLKGKAPVFSNQVTILEFWRPSCGNCKAQIPHLTALQKQYGERLSVVALSKEPLETLEEFIKINGDQMGYAIGKVTKDLGDAFMTGISGVPFVYLVNKDGLIVWKGHPANIDEILSRTIEGNIDIEKLKTIALLEITLNDAIKTNDPDAIAPVARKLLLADPANEKGLEICMMIAKYNHTPELLKETFSRVPQAELSGDKASVFAMMLVAESDLSYRYPEMALKLAFHALIKGPKNDSYMDVYARVMYSLGDLDKAVFWEKKALALNPAASYQANLDYYLAVKTMRAKSDYNSMTQLPAAK